MKKFAILVAGGKGSRMKTDTPKQFLLLKGEPVIIHTVRKFLQYDSAINLVIVLPADHMEEGLKILLEFLPDQAKAITYCTGGETRFQSVRNGLGKIGDDGLVAIHDAVRPLVTPDEIGKTYELAASKGSGVLVTEVKESLRKLNGSESVAVPRTRYRSVQTPQTFSVQLLKQAYSQQELPEFTDDASVFENGGHAVELVGGSYRNIKITTPEDLSIAEVMLS